MLAPVLAPVLIQLMECPGSWGAHACREYLLQRNFLCSGDKFISLYANQLSCTACSSRLCGNGSEPSGILGGLDPSYSPCPFLHLIPEPALCCVVLISRSQNLDVFPRKVLPLPVHGPFSSHILLLLTMCYYQQPLLGSTTIHV